MVCLVAQVCPPARGCPGCFPARFPSMRYCLFLESPEASLGTSLFLSPVFSAHSSIYCVVFSQGLTLYLSESFHLVSFYSRVYITWRCIYDSHFSVFSVLFLDIFDTFKSLPVD